jgi:hypothetical protein
MYKTRRCKRCDKGGAYHFNDLCPYHWDQLIDINIKKLINEWQNKKDP